MQKEGLLPSAALKKIEVERRTGTTPVDKGLLKLSTADKIALGAIGIAILYVYFTWKPLTSPIISPKQLAIEDIPGIDVESLYIVRSMGIDI